MSAEYRKGNSNMLAKWTAMEHMRQSQELADSGWSRPSAKRGGYIFFQNGGGGIFQQITRNFKIFSEGATSWIRHWQKQPYCTVLSKLKKQYFYCCSSSWIIDLQLMCVRTKMKKKSPFIARFWWSLLFGPCTEVD